jgi:hypothetical protein
MNEEPTGPAMHTAHAETTLAGDADPRFLLTRLLTATAPPAAVFVCALAGIGFLSEGIQKFLYPDALGAGCFLLLVGARGWLADAAIQRRFVR